MHHVQTAKQQPQLAGVSRLADLLCWGGTQPSGDIYPSYIGLTNVLLECTRMEAK